MRKWEISASLMKWRVIYTRPYPSTPDTPGAAEAPAPPPQLVACRVGVPRGVHITLRRRRSGVRDGHVLGSGAQYSPRHRVPVNSRNEGSKCVG